MFSKTCQIAIRAMLYIANKGTAETRIDLRLLSKELEVPKPFLGQIMQKLSGKRLIESSRGPKGGFFLTKSQRQQSLLDIIEATDGLHFFNECALGLKNCSDKKPCSIHNDVFPFRQHLKQKLEETTINEAVKTISTGADAILR